MNHFERRDGVLWAEDVPLADLAAAVGTPTYVYSAATLRRHFRVFDDAWASVPHLTCFAVKSCPSLGILALLARLGAGFDIVSAGELYRVVAAGGDPARIVFSGVGKTRAELAAALTAGIKCFNVESAAELSQLAGVARQLGVRAPVSLRINPDVDAQTHPYISTGLKGNKFGIPWSEARAAYAAAAAMPELDVVGLDCHIGSQLTKLAPLVEAIDKMLGLWDELVAGGMNLRHLDVGGGLGVRYKDETPPSPDAYAAALIERLGDRELTVLTEPGRVIVANSGALLMRCLLTKTNADKRFVVVDAAMNDNLRPTLYDAWQHIEPVAAPRAETQVVDVVGPICESGDFLAQDRELPEVRAGELLVMRSAGAYGMAMASNYNSRARPAEVLVDGAGYTVIRDRETLTDLIRGERVAPAGE